MWDRGTPFLSIPPEDKIFLIDGGGYPAFIEEISMHRDVMLVVPFLEYRRIKKLDLVVISHPHEDHYGGLLAVLDKFPVEMLVTNADLTESSAYRELLALAETKEYFPGNCRKRGYNPVTGTACNIDVLGPPTELFSGATSDANNNSLVLYLRYRKAGALFTGDIEAEGGELPFKRRTVAGMPAFKGTTSWRLPRQSLESLLESCFPSYSCYFCWESNSFGHPHPDVLSTLQEYNVHLYRTDLHGAVTIVTDGYALERQALCCLPLLIPYTTISTFTF
ncbi:MAG: ComEC/Rec2 family competence protein [Dethiobacteria bacterium]